MKYKTYYDHSEYFPKAPSHRLLAMFRGENEGFLKVSVYPPEEMSASILNRIFVKNSSDSAKQVELACKDAYKRLLQPSMETEMRHWAKEKADKEAIDVFTENLRQLLLSPPLGEKNVLAIDPGFRTGCKIVCLDKQGNLLHNETILSTSPPK